MQALGDWRRCSEGGGQSVDALGIVMVAGKKSEWVQVVKLEEAAT